MLHLGNSTQKARLYNSKITAATGEAKKTDDCAAGVKGTNSLRDELPVKEKGLTYYGDEVDLWWHLCLYQGMARLDQPGSEREKLSEALAKFELAFSLPIKDVQPRDATSASGKQVHFSIESATKLRGELTTKLAAAEQAYQVALARQKTRIDHATRAAAKGWSVAALAAWVSVEPIDKEMTKRRADAIAKLRAAAVEQAVVTVALVPAPRAGAAPQVLAQVRALPALAARPELRLVETGAKVQAALSVGSAVHDRKTDTVEQQHGYVSGQREIPNRSLERMREQLAYHEKEADWFMKKAESTRCNGSGKCSAESHVNSSRSHREKAQKLRQQIAKEPATQREAITSTHAFTADRTTVSARAELVVGFFVGGKLLPNPLTGTARVERSALRYPAEPSVKLAAREDRVPPPEELDSLLTAEAVRLLANGVLTAPAALAGEHDARAASSTDALEKLHYATIRALRSTNASDITAARSRMRELFASELDWTAVQAALQ